MGIVITVQTHGIGFLDLGDIHNNLASKRREFRSRADGAILLDLEEVLLPSSGCSNIIPCLSVFAAPLGVGGHLGAQIRFFFCLFIE